MQTAFPAIVFLLHAAAASANPTADELLRRANAILAPEEYEADVTFVTHKGPGDTRSFSLRILKKGTDHLRVRFLAPPDDAGSEFLRVGDNMWNFLPNLKRSLKISARQEFHGGDFSNSDVLRVDLVQDYRPTVLPSSSADEWLLDLRAKSDAVAYSEIKLWMRKKDGMPLREELYTGSGKLVRKLELTDVKKFGKLVRPSRYVMRNMVMPARYSEMTWNDFHLRSGIQAGQFDLDSLGR